MPPPMVTATEAVAQDVPVYIDEIGKTSASEAVTITPQVSGKIVARHFEDGANLTKGQLLFEIDPRPFQATLDQAQGQLAKDEAAKKVADWNVSQDQAALSTKAISEQQLQSDTSTRDQAVGSIAVDKAQIDAAKLNLEYCSIRSPIDGRASKRLVDVGNVVTGSGQMAGTNLLLINRLDPIYADFTVTEAELSRVKQFMDRGTLEVQVQTPADAAMTGTGSAAASAPEPATMPAGAAPEMVFHPRNGKLIFLDNAVQDASGTVALRAELPNADEHFWPGQFVNVRLVLTMKKSILVPNVATQISQQGLFVYKVTDDEKSPTKLAAMQQPVVVGQRHGDLVVIDSGLSPGDRVVTTGQMTLQPGSPVTLVNAGAAPVAPGGAVPKVGPGMLKSPNNEGEPKSGPAAAVEQEKTSVAQGGDR